MAERELRAGDVLPEELVKRLPAPGKARILYFMRSADCPVCVSHLRQLAADLKALTELGATVIAFVPDAGATVQVAGKPLIFPVVSGPDAYGQLGLRKALLGVVQQSGSAVIDSSGRLLHLKRATIPYAAIDVPAVYAALKAAQPLNRLR